MFKLLVRNLAELARLVVLCFWQPIQMQTNLPSNSLKNLKNKFPKFLSTKTVTMNKEIIVLSNPDSHTIIFR